MSFDDKHRLEQERRLKSNASAKVSLSNNSKWRKLFLAVSEVLVADKPWVEPGLKKCNFKLLGDEHVREACWPNRNDLLETYIRDGVWGCPVNYKDIEWVEIPASYQLNPNAKATQNIDEVFSRIESLGKFEIKLTESEIVIYGYR